MKNNNRASSIFLTILSVAAAISVIAWVFSYLIAHAATYEITGRSGVLPLVQFMPQPPENPVFAQAMALFKEWGVRPYWTLPSLKIGQKTTLQQADEAIEYLIPCESAGKDENTIDSNATTSYGILQIQMATWDEWSKESGIPGTPDAPDDAIRMAEWAIMNGDIGAWTCAHILGLVPKVIHN